MDVLGSIAATHHDQNDWWKSPLLSLIAGGIGGTCEVLTGQPMDTVKVRLQTHVHSSGSSKLVYKGTLDCFLKTVKYEGFWGLYKGLLPPLAAQAPIYATFFSGFAIGEKIVGVQAHEPFNITKHCMAGAIAGCMCATVTTPMEQIKCMMQVTHTKRGPSPFRLIGQLWSAGGLRMLFRGFRITLMRDVPGSILYLGAYEVVLSKLCPLKNVPSHKCIHSHPGKVALAGGLAGWACWGGIFPIDALKSKIQTSAISDTQVPILKLITQVISRDGWFGLYRGLPAVLLRSFPATAACYLSYETVLVALERKFHNSH